MSAFRFILKRELERKLPQMYDELCVRMHDGTVLRVSQARGREVKERVDKAWRFA